MKNRVALIFIYNHRYDRNISILENIYKDRFKHIYHLVPFYDGNKPNVIPVYENSFYFQGYLAQGLKYYFSEDYDHYFFVADDLVLNPAINEDNYAEYFKVSGSAGYIPEIFHLHDLHNNDTLRFTSFDTTENKMKKLYWWRNQDAVRYNHQKNGVESTGEMPCYSEAERILKQHGFTVKPLVYSDIYGKLFPLSLFKDEGRMHAAKYLYHLRSFRRNGIKLSYPLVGAYSDILIVPAASIKRFCHYCGVFAANELFVEFAIPTALLLSCSSVITEPDIGSRGSIYWTYTANENIRYEEAIKEYDYDLEKLLLNFPADKLYIHPVKLSKWKISSMKSSAIRSSPPASAR